MFKLHEIITKITVIGIIRNLYFLKKFSNLLVLLISSIKEKNKYKVKNTIIGIVKILYLKDNMISPFNNAKKDLVKPQAGHGT